MPGIVHEPSGRDRVSCLYPGGEEVMWRVDRRLLEVGIDHLSPASMAGILDQWIQYYAVAAHRPFTVGSCYNLSPDTIWRAYLQGIPARLINALTCLPARRGDRPALPVGGKFLRKLRRMAECQRWIWSIASELSAKKQRNAVDAAQSACWSIQPKAQVFLCRMGPGEGKALLRRIVESRSDAAAEGQPVPRFVTVAMVRAMVTEEV
jgi:hypothetical protein